MNKETFKTQLNNRLAEVQPIITKEKQNIIEYQDKIKQAKSLVSEVTMKVKGLQHIESYGAEYVTPEIAQLNAIKQSAESEVNATELLLEESQTLHNTAVSETTTLKIGLKDLDQLDIGELEAKLNDVAGTTEINEVQ